MRIPTLGALTLAAAAAVVAVPTAAHAVAPTAVPDSAQTDRGAANTFNVLTNDKAAEANIGRDLVVTSTSDPANGTATCGADGACTYTPDPGFSGTETFTYDVADSTNVTETSAGTVTVTTFDVGTLGINVVKANTTTRVSKVGWPDRIDLSTTVKSPSGALLSGVDVTLFAKPADGEYSKVVTERTNTQGAASHTLRPDAMTSYQWRTTAKQSSTRTLTVTPTLTATFDKKRLAVGDTTVISGVSAPATAGDSVLLQKLTSTGSWATVDDTTFAESSTATAPDTGAAYSFDVPASAEGSSTYRVRLPAQSGRNTVTSTDTTGVVRAYTADVTDVETGSAATGQDEWVKISNTGTTIGLKLAGWKLSNGTETLTIPTSKVVNVAPGNSIKIHTGSGKNNTGNFYLRLDPVWANNTSGSMTVKDKNGFAIDAVPFPYGP